MNWDELEGKWKQYKGNVKERWGKFTDDDLDVIDGKRQQLVGRIQERYGLARDAAEKQADQFLNSLHSAGARDAGEEGQHESHQHQEVRQDVRKQEKAHRSGQR
jgi:uncharacterized protein YjbJ (UPF0337 family)